LQSFLFKEKRKGFSLLSGLLTPVKYNNKYGLKKISISIKTEKPLIKLVFASKKKTLPE
jgi:hypothetical protein